MTQIDYTPSSELMKWPSTPGCQPGLTIFIAHLRRQQALTLPVVLYWAPQQRLLATPAQSRSAREPETNITFTALLPPLTQCPRKPEEADEIDLVRLILSPFYTQENSDVEISTTCHTCKVSKWWSWDLNPVSLTSESTGKLFGTFWEACSEKYYLCWFDSKCPMCPLISTCAHQSFAFQNEAVDPNMNKWRCDSNFKTDVLLFLLNGLLFNFSPNLGAKGADFPWAPSSAPLPWNI